MKTKFNFKLTVVAIAFLTMLTETSRAADAAEIFQKHCVACHGKDGRGQTKMGKKVDVKDYTDAKVQAELTDEKAAKSIKEGIKDDKGKERMKAYGEELSADEIKALVAHVRTFKAP